MAPLTKRDRVLAALRGGEVDHVPVSAWGHDFLREWTAEGLTEATLDAYRRYDWDFIKVNPRASYYVEDWGCRFQPSGRADAPPQSLATAINSPADLRSLRPLDPSLGAYGEQLAALRLIRDGLAGEAPFIQTVFSPLAVASRLAGSHEPIRQYMEAAPQDLEAALAAISETLAAYAGTYFCPDLNTRYAFFVRDGQLMLQHRKMKVRALEPTVEDAFSAQASDIVFSRDGHGDINGCDIFSERIRYLRFDRER